MEEIIVEEELFHLNKSQSIAGAGYSSSTSTDSFTNRMFGTALLVDKYYTPLLCLFGALGNCLSLAVFCLDAKYRSQSSSYYLSALALSDTGFLLNVFVVWLEGVYGGVITLDIICPLVMYLGQVTCFMSVYFTVAFSIERYVAVHYPFSRPRICTRSKAKKAIGVITVLALLLFSYAWVIAKVITIPTNELGNTLVSQNAQENQKDHLEQPADNLIVTKLPALEVHSTIPTLDPLYVDKNQNHIWKLHHRSSKVRYNSFMDGSQRITDYMTNRNKLLQSAGEFGENNNIFHNIPQPTTSSTILSNSPEGAQHDIDIHIDCDVDDDDDDRGAYGYNETIDGGNGGRCICSVPEVYYKISEIANYIDSILTLIFPFFLIAFFNVRIAVTVWKLKDQRRNIVATTANNTNGSSVSTAAYSQNNHFCNRQGVLQRSMRGTTSTTQALYRNSRKNNFCYSLNMNNKGENRPDEGGGGGSRQKNCHSGGGPSSTVRFQDCIEMSQMESNTHCSQSLSVSLNNIQSGSVHTTTTVTPANPRFCIFRRKKSSSSSEVRVTKTLLLVSLLFVLLNLPAHAIRCAQFLQTITGTKQGQDLLFALQPWANILFNTNFAVNFLLYCVSGKNFRNSLRNIALRNCQCPNQRSKMTSKFSWTSDKRNKRKRTNSCITGTASTLLPSTATLATTTEREGDIKTRSCRVPKYSPATGALLNCQDDLANGFCERGNPEDEEEESTAVYFAYYSHDSHVNYLDEVRDDLDEENIDEIVSV